MVYKKPRNHSKNLNGLTKQNIFLNNYKKSKKIIQILFNNIDNSNNNNKSLFVLQSKNPDPYSYS